MLCAWLCLSANLAGTAAPAAAGASSPQERAPLSASRAVARPAAASSKLAAQAAAGAQTGSTLFSEGFSAAQTVAHAWTSSSGVCLTAGTAGTPASSIPACGAAAPQDPIGQGAVQLTAATGGQSAFLLANVPIPTANGLQITFTDYSFNGTTPGADGLALFMTDASKAAPAGPGQFGGSLGYANENGQPGLANAYLGLGFDEYGNFSNPTQGRNGGPGAIPETIAVRGSAASNYVYLGGALNAKDVAASLPFSFDQPTLTTRPLNAPTMRVVLTPAGVLTVSIDHHDGNGFVIYYSQSIAAVAGQGPVPANVYLGFTASTGGNYNRHQIGSFSVTTLAPLSTFTPAQIPNLTAWFDAAGTATVTTSGTNVTQWADRSGNGNTVAQTNAAAQPAYTSAGINGLGSIVFAGKNYLVGSNTSFSSSLLNESTVFAVTNQTNTADSSVMWSGAYLSDPRWNLRLTETGVSHFDFNNKEAGRLVGLDKPTGPALWTAQGSISGKSQFLRKNGSVIASDAGPGASVKGSYPLAIGATYGPGQLSYQYSGQIGEIVTFGRALTAAESAEMEGYLACKWGLQTRLPSNHPYRYTCPQGGASTPIPTTPPAATVLQNPPELRSVNGQLNFNVVAQANPATGNPQFSYNGSAVPPTLRLLPGDSLIVNYTNNLPVPPAGAGYTNATNLHYHGLHVSPNAPGDDEIDMLAQPGQTLHYVIAIPAAHPTGLYWYHTHAHGEAERQTLSGMSGALIIDGIASYAPQVANMEERVIVARDNLPAGQALPLANIAQVNAMHWAMQHARAAQPLAPVSYPAKSRSLSVKQSPGATAPKTLEVRGKTTAQTNNPFVLTDSRYRKLSRALTAAADTHCTGPETAAKTWTLNGQAQPSIGIRPGEQQFWRLVNAGADTYMNVAVDGATLQVVAVDGVPVGNGVNVPSTVPVSNWLLPPASRVEFIVTGPPAGTQAYLRTECFDAGAAGAAMPAATLASIDPTSSLTDQAVARSPQRIALSANRFTRTASFVKQVLRAQAASTVTQTVTYSDQNTINGYAYNPGAPPLFYAQSGTVQQWTIVNNSQQVHTFHIHQIHFLVQAINGVTQSQQFMMDNVNVPAATATGPGTVTLLLDFTDPLIVGTFLLHCHILSHEDAGMMAQIRVGTAPPLSLSASSLTFASPAAASAAVTIAGGAAPFSVTGCGTVCSASVSGSTVTVKPSAAGASVLTVSDSTGLTATIAITVNGAVSPLSLAPNSLSFAGTGVPAQTAAISGGTPPYIATGCNGVASSTISGGTMTVTPVAVGSCTYTITDAASNQATLPVSINAAVTSNPQDNLTFHQNAMRQGWYSAETQLNTTTVASSNFGLLTTLTAPQGSLFGKVYAQPLYVTNQTVADGSKHNLVIVATATDQVYAYDDQTFNIVWHRDLTNANETTGIVEQQSWSDTGCSDVNPDVGITGTPVIDRAQNVMFLVAATKEFPAGTPATGTPAYHQRLHAISLASGADALTPADITATVPFASGGTVSLSPLHNFNRSALLEANGNIYIAFGSHCDYSAGATHGWILSYAAANLAPSGSAVLSDQNDGSGYYLGSPWMSGYGPAADAQGNVYFATGNGPWNGTTNFSMSVMKVPGNLSLGSASYFTPYGEAADSSADADLGSGGVMLLPDQTSGAYPHLLVQGGKCGAGGSSGTVGCQKWLLNRDQLGGRQAGDTGALWHADTGGGIWGGPAYFQDASANQYLVYGTISTYKLSTNPYSLVIQSTASPGCLECRDSGSQPIVSSNGTQAGTAVVWALKTPGNSGGNITLYAFDALTMSHTLFSGVAGPWTQTSGSSWIGGALVSPAVANGRVYVPTDGGVAVFGEK
jgi:FtsP/CotA-like multicopper oxidase with cupredoxin domain